MKKHGLGTQNGKMCPESLTGNTPNIPQFIRIRPICQNRPIGSERGISIDADSGPVG